MKGEVDDQEAGALGALADLAGGFSGGGRTAPGSRGQQPAGSVANESDLEPSDEEGEIAPQGLLQAPKHPQDMQKWVQCARCNCWRRVPYDLREDDTPDDWECQNNVWDEHHASCSVPQELTDKEIDNILALQDAAAAHVAPHPLPSSNGLPYVKEPPDGVGLEDDYAGGGSEDDGGGSRRASVRNRGKPNMKVGGRRKAGLLRNRAVAAAAAAAAMPGVIPGTSAMLDTAAPSRELPAAAPFMGAPPSLPPVKSGRGGRPNGKGYGAKGGRGGKAAASGETASNVTPGKEAAAAGRRIAGAKGRKMGKGGKPPRMNRGVSEAAEALLGMGFGETMDDEDTLMAHGELEMAEPRPPPLPVEPLPMFPRSCFRPGAVVWAKVEGHDWWPARVVRRRAVPREVGPPPGAPLSHIPVVFFTAKGIPGEDTAALNSMEGAMAACVRAMQISAGRSGSSEAEEEEYAWLAHGCLKPFVQGDGVGSKPAGIQADPTLQACIAAAERAVSAQRPASAATSADPRQSGDEDAELDGSAWPNAESDSDGGWAVPLMPQLAAAPKSARPVRAGRGRRKGGRRGQRGKGRYGGGGLEDDSDDDGDPASTDLPDAAPAAPAAAPGPPKITVDAIFGWRWPLSEEDQERIRQEQQEHEMDRQQKLEALQASIKPEEGAASLLASSRQPALAGAPDSRPPTPPGQMRQDEADAVAALLAASGSGEVPGEEADMGDPTGQPGREPEYLVKWVGKSHMHDEWVTESLLMRIGKRKLINFRRRYGEAPCDLIDTAWRVPERFVARRPSPLGPGWEVLTKWTKLGYEACTWEAESEGALVHPDYLPLFQGLWQRQQAAVQRADPSLLEAAAAVQEGVRGQATGQLLAGNLPAAAQLAAAPSLHPHQLGAINAMRALWAGNMNALLAHEPGLGKTATAVVFAQCLRHEFKCLGPVLVVAPQSGLTSWEGEWEFWVGPEANVVTYTGTQSARATIYDHEIWLSPDSLDAKSSFNRLSLPEQVIKPDVVLTSMEALAGDAAELQQINWDLIIVDERSRARSSVAKAHTALKDFPATSFRLQLSHGLPLQDTVEDLQQTLGFLRPQGESIPTNLEDLEEEQQVEELRRCVRPHLQQQERSEVGAGQVVICREALLPVDLTPAQADCYRLVLARSFDMLADPRPARHSGHRAAQLRAICAELRKVCTHTDQVQEVEEVEDISGHHLESSGKLQLLDRLLQRICYAGKRALLLSVMPKGLESLVEFATERFGSEAVVAIDGAMPPRSRYTRMQRFCAPDSEAFLLLMHTRACGLGTDLPNVDVVIVHDSDWSHCFDTQHLLRAHSIGGGRPLTLMRLVMRGTVEERILQLSLKKCGNAAILKGGTGGRASASSMRLLEDVLRWGVCDLFQNSAKQGGSPTSPAKPAIFHGSDAPMEDAPSPSHTPKQEPDPSDNDGEAGPDAAKHPRKGSYSDAALDALVDLATGGENGEPVGDAAAEDMVRSNGLGDVVVLREPSLTETPQDEQEPAEEGEEEEDRPDGQDAEEGEVEEGQGTALLRSESSLDAASFWDNLLQETWQRLQREEEAAMAAAGPPALTGRRVSRDHGGLGTPGQPGADSSTQVSYEEDGEEVSKADGYGAASSMYRDDDGLEDLHYARPGRGRGRGGRSSRVGQGRGRGKNRRRWEASQEAEEAAQEALRPGKRRRRLHPDGRGAAPGGPLNAEAEASRSEWLQYEAVLSSARDMRTMEGRVAQRAADRLTSLANELALGSRAAEMAVQAAMVLLAMRPKGEPPSDFQDHTLVALIAVAGHLGAAQVGASGLPSLPALAQRYGQPAEGLQQLFQYILACLGHYRQLHARLEAFTAEGVLDLGPISPPVGGPLNQDDGQEDGTPSIAQLDGRGGLEATPMGPSAIQIGEQQDGRTGPVMPPFLSDLDAFGARLASIVMADLSAHALNAGPLDVPLSPLQALSTHMPMEPNGTPEGQALVDETEAIIKNLRGFQEQVALLDRIHSIRIRFIQDEYQKYMERVRSKAQGAIDTANSQYQHNRTMVTQRVDHLVHHLQRQHHLMGGQQGGSTASPSSPTQGEDEAGREGGASSVRQGAMQMTSPGAALLPPANAENGYSWQQRTETRDIASLPGSQQSPALASKPPLVPRLKAGQPPQALLLPGGSAGGRPAASGKPGGAPQMVPGYLQPSQGPTGASGSNGTQAFPNGSLNFQQQQQQQQQQAVLARQLAGGAGGQLPLQRLSPQATQQVMSTMNSQQAPRPSNLPQDAASSLPSSFLPPYPHRHYDPNTSSASPSAAGSPTEPTSQAQPGMLDASPTGMESVPLDPAARRRLPSLWGRKPPIIRTSGSTEAAATAAAAARLAASQGVTVQSGAASLGPRSSSGRLPGTIPAAVLAGLAGSARLSGLSPDDIVQQEAPDQATPMEPRRQAPAGQPQASLPGPAGDSRQAASGRSPITTGHPHPHSPPAQRMEEPEGSDGGSGSGGSTTDSSPAPSPIPGPPPVTHHPSPAFGSGPLLPGRLVQTGSGELPPIHPGRIVVSGPSLGHSNSFDRRLQHQDSAGSQSHRVEVQLSGGRKSPSPGRGRGRKRDREPSPGGRQMQGASRAGSPHMHRPNTVTSNQAGPRESRGLDPIESTPFQTYSMGPRLDQRSQPVPDGTNPSQRREPPLLIGRPQQPRISHPHDRMPHFEMGQPAHSPSSMMPHLPASPTWQQQQRQQSQEGVSPSGYPSSMGQSPSDPRTRREARGDPAAAGAAEGGHHPGGSPTRSPRRHHPSLQETAGHESGPPHQSGHLPGLPVGVHMSGGPHPRAIPRPQPPSSRFAEMDWSPEPGGPQEGRTHPGDMPPRLYSFNHWAEGRHSEGHSPGMTIRGRSSGALDAAFQFAPGPPAAPNGLPSNMPRPANQ
ncbi:hypothetical protein WJX74_009858 [Apatococcus lobatus]|uniref:Uncharacterized protein n=1 Tax=Apatococcus lobatus TaxID=904363 RepID=A0AAW1RZD0_9CHLO